MIDRLSNTTNQHTQLPPVREPQEDSDKRSGEPEQLALLDAGKPWEEHWKGMPEFVQKDLTPFKTIYVHFENRKDMGEFAALVEQTITIHTRSIWYPEAEIGRYANKRFVEAPLLEPERGIELPDEK